MIGGALAIDSMVSCGCIVSGSTIRRPLLFSKVRVNSYCKIVEVVVLPDVNIGRHARLNRVVLDRGRRRKPTTPRIQEPMTTSTSSTTTGTISNTSRQPTCRNRSFRVQGEWLRCRR